MRKLRFQRRDLLVLVGEGSFALADGFAAGVSPVLHLPQSAIETRAQALDLADDRGPCLFPEIATQTVVVTLIVDR